MNLEISSFADAGHPSKERIVLRALVDIDVGEYAVFRSGVSSSGEPTSGRKAADWFPDAEVKANDLVVLYTKKGILSTKPLGGGRTAHFFYWGRDDTFWGESGHCAVVLHVSDWTFRVV